MPKYDVVVFYRAKEGFTIEAATPEEAAAIARDGDPGERNFDEYLGNEAIEVYAADSDSGEPLYEEED